MKLDLHIHKPETALVCGGSLADATADDPMSVLQDGS